MYILIHRIIYDISKLDYYLYVLKITIKVICKSILIFIKLISSPTLLCEVNQNLLETEISAQKYIHVKVARNRDREINVKIKKRLQ